jgi:D-alanine-D-alanine ligase
MAAGMRGFVPILHAATESRPDELDTIVAADAVAAALKRLGFATQIVALGAGLAELDGLPPLRPLAVFNLVDAVKGDGRLAPSVPARLDALGLRYTGAGTNAWYATLSKTGTKLLLKHIGLPTPSWSVNGVGLDPDEKVIVKAVWEHGSLGLGEASVMRGAEAAKAIVARNSKWGTDHFAETFVEGREFNVALLDGLSGVEVLPIAEIAFERFAEPTPKIVGYDAKWMPESEAYIGTPRCFGLELDTPGLAAQLKLLALSCWTLFQLSGYARVDFRVDATGAPFILEVNMNPCLSPDAGFAAAAAEGGLGYDAMVGRIVEASLGALRASA